MYVYVGAQSVEAPHRKNVYNSVLKKIEEFPRVVRSSNDATSKKCKTLLLLGALEFTETRVVLVK